MSKKEANLSIIIISYNTKDLLKNCIDSILKNTKKINYEIIVIDNASNDQSAEYVERIVSKVPIKIIKNNENIGFGPANNQGAQQSKARYVLFLNSDTYLSDNCLKDMVQWMDKHPDVGVASCALKNPDGSLQATGGYFPDLLRIFAWMFFIEDIPLIDKIIKPFHPMHQNSFLYKGVDFFKKAGERDWLTGAFLLCRRGIIKDAGYFDEDYFMYTEEVDLCYRIKNKGWKVWYLPKWSITHIGGASSDKEFPFLAEFEGVKIFYRKHKPSWQYPVLRLFLKCGALLRILLFGLLKGRYVAEIYTKAFKIA